MKLQPGEFYVAVMNNLPRIPFGRDRGITDNNNMANRMAVVWHADGFRRKLSYKYRGRDLFYLWT